MDKKTAILVVEDEAAIREGLVDFLTYQGFQVEAAEDGLQAQRQVRDRSFDLILLDLMLPQISGEQLCQQWRQNGLQTPIIMLTAKGQEVERIAGLNMGADDYVTKPFSLEELLARIRAILRRIDPHRSVGQCFTVGDLQVNMAALIAKRADQEISLSQREADLLAFFAAHPNRVLNREEIYEQVWHDQMTDLGTRTVDMHIAKLRGKIEKDSTDPQIIKTVRGAGYKYEDV
ncbi:response regulator transcription factor [Planctomycetota bacterium]